jgi:hypothetical protein
VVDRAGPFGDLRGPGTLASDGADHLLELRTEADEGRAALAGFPIDPAACLDTRIPEMVSCQESLDTGEAGVADRAAAAGTRATVLPTKRIAVDVAAPSARRDGIAAWPWRYPGSP